MKPKSKEDPKQGLPVSAPHAVAGGAALGAAIAGGAIGSVAGPVGTVAGAAIGGVLGIAIGATLEEEERSSSAHERELDETIGLTSGTIGEPTEHKRPSLPPKE